MDEQKLLLTQHKYKLPYHWIRDPLNRDSLVYFGYIKVILGQLPNTPSRILDAGCGSGRVAKEMLEQGHEVVGIDYLESNVYYATLLVPEGIFAQGDLRQDLTESHDFVPESFDVIVSVEVYEHIPPEDSSAVLSNFLTLLKPGGKLIISAPSKALPQSQLHYRHFDEQNFKHELAEAGFDVTHVIKQHSLDKRTSWLLYGEFDRFVDNNWLRPHFLKRWRRRYYLNNSNIVEKGNTCGRYIAVATKN